MSEFFQESPRLTNTFESHRWLKSYLRFKLPREMYSHIEADLHALGERCAEEYLQLARQAEREKPYLVQFDPWGRRIDEIRVSRAWEELQHISAREGMINIGYKRAHGEHSRLYQFTKLFLFHPSSAFFTCPLAMADGAAKVLETYGSEEMHRQAFSHLTSTSPQEFWTSGQWMTEKSGGSDVSDTSTVVKFDGEQARLYGTKWFSSATTSQMALALARQPDAPAGSKGLTLYLVPMRSDDGDLNHVRILRLKDKLGTWALPTAELQLEGCLAYQVGESGKGVKTVASMLNITRLYNSICSVAQASRALESLSGYAAKRKVFGKPLQEHELHYKTFALEELKTMAGTLLTLELVHLLGKEECRTASPEDADLLRLLTPICKLFTARSSIQTASEVVEGFGGVGYIEDSGIPVHLRDAQVFPIWEGATNVLSLDMLRVLQKPSVAQSLAGSLQAKLGGLKTSVLKEVSARLVPRLKALQQNLNALAGEQLELQIASSRDLAFFLAKLYAFTLLLEWADSEAEANRVQLLPWIHLYESSYLGEWHVADQRELSAARKISETSLKL